MAIFNQYKNTLNNFINRSNNSSDTEFSAILRQIDILSNNIPSFENGASNLKRERNLLRNGSQRYQQRHDTFSFSLGAKKSNRKVWRKKDNRDKRTYWKKKKEIIEKRERISKISIYYHMIYKWVD